MVMFSASLWVVVFQFEVRLFVLVPLSYVSQEVSSCETFSCLRVYVLCRIFLLLMMNVMMVSRVVSSLTQRDGGFTQRLLTIFF